MDGRKPCLSMRREEGLLSAEYFSDGVAHQAIARMREAVQIVRVRIVEHAARNHARCEKAFDGGAILVEDAAFGVHEQTSRGAKSVGKFFRSVIGRGVDGHHHVAGEAEVFVLSGGGHGVPSLDGGHEFIYWHFHQFGKLFERIGFQGFLAARGGRPGFLGTVA